MDQRFATILYHAHYALSVLHELRGDVDERGYEVTVHDDRTLTITYFDGPVSSGKMIDVEELNEAGIDVAGEIERVCVHAKQFAVFQVALLEHSWLLLEGEDEVFDTVDEMVEANDDF